MKNRKKRAQREEVRKILHEMRLQLAAGRLAREKGVKESAMLSLPYLMSQARGRYHSL